jgi:hypothetical protein
MRDDTPTAGRLWTDVDRAWLLLYFLTSRERKADPAKTAKQRSIEAKISVGTF